MFVIELITGIVPGIGATCTEEWVYPKCMFAGLALHALIYTLATYLWKKEYFIQEDKLMAEAER